MLLSDSRAALKKINNIETVIKRRVNGLFWWRRSAEKPTSKPPDFSESKQESLKILPQIRFFPSCRKYCISGVFLKYINLIFVAFFLLSVKFLWYFAALSLISAVFLFDFWRNSIITVRFLWYFVDLMNIFLLYFEVHDFRVFSSAFFAVFCMTYGEFLTI